MKVVFHIIKLTEDGLEEKQTFAFIVNDSPGPILFRTHHLFLSVITRVLSTGGSGGGKLRPKRPSFPPKVFLKKKLKLFQIKIFFDDDFKESVKVTNVQKCDFSQS